MTEIYQAVVPWRAALAARKGVVKNLKGAPFALP